ncbi:MAG: hypothetical protein BWY99_01898 [Synergistetes bacterium ADurb.BinA166]|nr:MAG: hypothetical protein BWY99_01898 [Synergistetes bacterium ADurb.BinA166]
MGGMDCKTCGGAGTYEKGEKTMECECSLWDRVASSMPPYILSARFTPKHLESPLLGCVNRSCFVQGSWVDVRAIAKAVMMKHYAKLFRVTSDRELRDVFMGSKNRSNLDEDAKVVFNSVEDVMGGGDQKGRATASPDLVIVRLNELAYKNKAASGILEEALSCRVDYGRATWVVSDIDKPFGTGSHAYSESVWDMLTTRFAVVKVPRISPRFEIPPPEPQSISPRPRSLDLDPEPVRERPEPVRGPATPAPREEAPAEERPRRSIQSVPDDDAPKGISMYGSGRGKKSSSFGSSKKTFGRGD